MHRRLAFSNALPCKAGNNVAEPSNVGTIKGVSVKALPNWLPMLRSSGRNVPRGLFLLARMAVAAIKSLAPGLPGVLPRTAASKWCQERIRLDPTRDSLARIDLVSVQATSIATRLLGMVPLDDCRSHGIWQRKSRASATGTLMNALSILDRLRGVSSAAVSLPCSLVAQFQEHLGKKVRNRAVFPCITFCEGLVPDAEPPSLRSSQMLKSSNNHPRASSGSSRPVENKVT